MDRSSPALADARPPRYWFAGFMLRADGTLFCGDSAVGLAAEELAVLRLLLERAGEIVCPLELKRAVWGDAQASGDVVAKCIASLRERLERADCIEKAYKRGYRISADVRTSVTRPAGALPRLAILPFSVGFGVPEYLGSAIAEETAAQLCGGDYAVASIVARESVLTLARRGFAAHEIGKTLEADLVLGGELHATPERLKLRVEMIRVEDGAQLWVEDLMVGCERITELERELVKRMSCRIESGRLTLKTADRACGGRQAPSETKTAE
jgi:DNA-binding winged helix-turn-helix (wHTH) protein